MVTWVTSGPAIIVLSIAFLIAVIVYSWQKRREREQPLLAVKRVLYGDFFASIEILYQQAGKGSPEEFQDFLSNTLGIYKSFIFSVPITVISPCRMAILGVEVFDYNCRKKSASGSDQNGIEIQMAATEAKRVIRAAMKAMREDLLGSTSANSEYAVNLVYGPEPTESFRN
ncbi:MAG: hypothetical protein ACTSRN_01255 [Alphaproteobacteria bacterium]